MTRLIAESPPAFTVCHTRSPFIRGTPAAGRGSLSFSEPSSGKYGGAGEDVVVGIGEDVMVGVGEGVSVGVGIGVDVMVGVGDDVSEGVGTGDVMVGVGDGVNVGEEWVWMS